MAKRKRDKLDDVIDQLTENATAEELLNDPGFLKGLQKRFIERALEAEMTFQTEIMRYADTWEKVSTGTTITDSVEIRRGIVLYNMMMTVQENRFHQYQAQL